MNKIFCFLFSSKLKKVYLYYRNQIEIFCFTCSILFDNDVSNNNTLIFVGELKLLLHVVDNDFQVKLNHLDDLQTVFFNNFKTNTVIRTRYEKQTLSKIYHLFRNRKERKKSVYY
jgi:hypothetical protein